ncbi:Glutathione S-transferase Mu 2 [Saguinus oedipus]|uniref:glutathione transferase n=1 Tax=Saguinus oedipus TaxID=9490 RepID=A0ABQ9V508_SAGOE|nr:Glutathione S-transferase Mu 2 [Saguinus oedipus]
MGLTRSPQSNAILRYTARKHNLCGETEKENIWEDILENQLMDDCMQLARLCYDPDFERLKPEYVEGLPEMLKLYSVSGKAAMVSWGQDHLCGFHRL